MRNLLFISFFINSLCLFGQTSLRMVLKVDIDDLQLNQTYFIPQKHDSIQISKLRFYISHIRCFSHGVQIGTGSEEFYLLDAAHPESLLLPLDTDEPFDQITFTLGIDSADHYLGIKSGALDPLNDMYWTWQSGYIQWKMEGISAKSKARKNKFTFHLGGFSGASRCDIYCSVKSTGTVTLDLVHLFGQLDLSTLDHLMLPSPEAAALMMVVSESFVQEP